jgi:hypothetical protein
MFIDKAIVILGILCLVAWGIANLIVAFHYSIKSMVECFWKEQTIMGKICANVFYTPAWVLIVTLTAVVCLAYWVCAPLYNIFKKFVCKFLYPLYARAIKFEL